MERQVSTMPWEAQAISFDLRSKPERSVFNVQSQITRGASTMLLGIAVMATLSSNAWAQSDEEKARTFYEEGVKSAYAGNYGEAIYQFKQGHTLAPNGLFTYNITIAYLKTNNFDDALRYARETEERHGDLDEKLRTRNLARMSAIHTRRHTLDAAADISDALEKAQASKSTDATLTEPTTSGRSGLGGVGYAGLGITVLGSGLMLGSLYFNNKLKGYVNDDGTISAEDEAEAVKARTSGLALLISGSAVALTGVGMFVYALGSRNKGAKANLMLAPTRGGAAMGINVRF
ncbi:MAG: hypothetical protein VYE40_16490 [Myxococcota bacterium]|nr:hypothetical protein [Myxococcota bacterium]